MTTTRDRIANRHDVHQKFDDGQTRRRLGNVDECRSRIVATVKLLDIGAALPLTCAPARETGQYVMLVTETHVTGPTALEER